MKPIVKVRTMRIWDILPVYSMHISLTGEERRLYHPFPFIPWKMLLYLGAFYVSSGFGALGRSLVPRVAFYTVVAIDTAGHARAGFAYLQERKCQQAAGRTATLGIMVASGYRGQGISRLLMDELLVIAGRLGLAEVNLTVMQDNTAAIELYKKFGFRIVDQAGYEIWEGVECPYYDMKLTPRPGR